MLDFEKHREWPAVKAVCETLQKSGYQAWLAGGCVRDALLEREPKDFDVVTNARPEEIEKLFAKTLAVGKSFGVIVVVLGEVRIEVATFRRDAEYKDGRHPSGVEFVGPEADAQRRDFTVNALFYDVTHQQVVDFVSGEKDLREGLLRTVGAPEARFVEDRLRMLRAIRFAAQLQFRIEDETFQALQVHRGELLPLSGERIQQEFVKLHLSPSVAYGLGLLVESGLAQVLLPEWVKPQFSKGQHGASHWAVTQALFIRMGSRLNFGQAWALLWWSLYREDLVSWERIEAIGERWRFSNQIQSAAKFYLHTMKAIAEDEAESLADLVEALAHPGREFLKSWAQLWQGWCEQELARWKQARDLAAKVLVGGESLPEPLLNGQDVMAVGFSGREVGQILTVARRRQLLNDLTDRDAALIWLRAQKKV